MSNGEKVNITGVWKGYVSEEEVTHLLGLKEKVTRALLSAALSSMVNDAEGAADTLSEALEALAESAVLATDYDNRVIKDLQTKLAAKTPDAPCNGCDGDVEGTLDLIATKSELATTKAALDVANNVIKNLESKIAEIKARVSDIVL